MNSQGNKAAVLNESWLTPDQELLERHAVLQSPARIEELVKVFIHATKVSRSTNREMRRHRMLTGCRWKLHFGKCTAQVDVARQRMGEKRCAGWCRIQAVVGCGAVEWLFLARERGIVGKPQSLFLALLCSSLTTVNPPCILPQAPTLRPPSLYLPYRSFPCQLAGCLPAKIFSPRPR